MPFPYDFGSFMHYDSYGFSKNGEPTIIPLDGRYAKTMGQREKAAFYDYKQINRLYCNRAGRKLKQPISIKIQFDLFLLLKNVHKCLLIMVVKIMVI
jgi:hypothetical protein